MATQAIDEAQKRLVEAARAFAESLGVAGLHESAAGSLDALPVATLGRLMQTADRLLNALWMDVGRSTSDDLTTIVAAIRSAAFLIMRQRDPDQAWFWTPTWQAGERQADADKVAGRTTLHESSEAFETALRTRRPDVADSNP